VEQREFERWGRRASVVGLGTWQLGADWGAIDEEEATRILEAAVASGVTFLDTADVYGDGRSERIIGAFLREHPKRAADGDGDGGADGDGGGNGIVVATKMGRRVPQHPDQYTLDNFRAWTDRSRANLGMDTLHLVQLHCPPTAVYGLDRVFDDLDTLVAEGRTGAYGVSVETCEEALTAIARPNVVSVQIILNAFRRKPLERVLPAARSAGVGVIARVPLASGLLSGRYRRDTVFAGDDHRTYNRHGEAFDVGETFSGVDYETGVEAAAEFSALAPSGLTPAQAALRWVAQQPGVTCVIPGARTVEQVAANAAAAAAPELDDATLRAMEDLYDRRIRSGVHGRW
jgi:aryl-alcohol dehydrogenase-like predicted oxidoreductase